LKTTESTFRRDGFKYPGLYKSADNSQFKKLNVLERQALTDLNKLFALLILRPDVELRNNDKSTPATYALYLIFRKLKMTDKNSRYVNISMKNGDAGEMLLKTRFYSLFDTGSSCVNELWIAFHTMFLAIVEKESDDKLNDLLSSFQEKCFTSTDGMLVNSYKIVKRTVTIKKKIRTKTGRIVDSKDTSERSGKDIPVLALAKAPLKEKEIAALQPLQSQFNDFAKVVDSIDDKVNSNNIFKKARIVEEVTKIAYSKIGTLRKFIKQRKGAIREEISREKKEVNQVNWLAAQAIILDKVKDIDVKSLELTWDINKLSGEIQTLLDSVSD